MPSLVPYGSRGRSAAVAVRLARDFIRKHGQRAWQRLQRQARLAGPRQVAAGSLAQRLGPTDPDSAVDTAMRRRPNFIKDNSSYQQYQKYKFKSGRKRTLASKRQSILQSIIANYRLRISNISTNGLAQGHGAYYVAHGYRNANEDWLPLLMCNLSSIRQGNTSAVPMVHASIWREPGTFNGNIQFQPVQSLTVDNAGAVVPSTAWQFEDNEGNVTAVGRKSFLDWCRIRLTLWGKQNAPAKFYIRLVKFSNDEFCPERQNLSISVGNNALNFYQALIKPLITDPSSSMLTYPKGAMKVLKNWTVEFDPISTTESDQDPHCKFLDIFHRFGKTMDYTTNTVLKRSADQVDNPNDFVDANDAGVTATNFGVLPRKLEDSVYLMITSLSQDKYTEVGPNRVNQASLSWNIQVAHKSVQPDIWV